MKYKDIISIEKKKTTKDILDKKIPDFQKKDEIISALDKITFLFAKVIKNLQFQVKDKKDSNFKSIIKVVKKLFKTSLKDQINITEDQKNNNKLISEFVNKIQSLVSNKSYDENSFEGLHEFMTKMLNEGFQQLINYFSKTGEILPIYKQLSKILQRPLFNLSDQGFVDSLKDILKEILKENIQDANNIDLIDNIIQIATQNDIQSLLDIIEYCNLVSNSEFKIIKETVNKVSSLSIYQNRGVLDNLNKLKPVVSDQMKEIRKKMLEGKMSPSDIFYSIDSQGNGDGTVSIEEFCNFLRRTGINMSQHRVNELFATIKKNRKTAYRQLDDNNLNLEEFEEAYRYITTKKIDMSLEKLGISPALLALSLGTLLIILVLLLVFIFLGIKAFALGGTFGSIINSIIPAVATSGAASSSHDKSDTIKDENVKGALKETQQILHSSYI